MEAKEKYIEQKGYSTNNWDDESKVVVSTYKTQPVELVTFDKETEQTKKKLEALKRKFALRLYAGGIEEIHTLFGELTKELEATVRA